MSSSDDSDSDYDPNETAVEAIDESEKVDLIDIPVVRKNKIDSLFSEMQSQDAEYMLKSRKKASQTVNTAIDGVSNKKLSILKSIFGSEGALKVAGNAGRKRMRNENGDADIKAAALEAAKKVKKTLKVQEIVKFAGKEITIEKSVMSLSTQPITAPKQITDSGLDKVIEDIKGAKTISTVNKSSIDWENFKEKEGLESDLAIASKSGYLNRKDFLERCDVRAFESERDLRAQTSSKL